MIGASPPASILTLGKWLYLKCALQGVVMWKWFFIVVVLPCILLVLAAIVMAAPAAAADYYLAPGGSGSTCSLASPCSDVSTAANKLVPGDTLYARGGTYAFRSYPEWSGMRNGTPTAPVTVRNYPGETPVFDGGMVSGEFMIPSGKSYWVLDGLTVQRFDNSAGNGAITPCGGSHHLTFQHMTFRDNGSRADNDHDIYPCGGSGLSGRVHDLSIHHNRFINGPGGALHMWHYQEAYNVNFYNNIVLNKRTGVYACDNATNIRIYHNTFVNTTNLGGRGTIVTSCGQQVNGAESLFLRNNIIYRAAAPAGVTNAVWQRSGRAGELEDHNLIFGGTTSWTLHPTDKRVDPQFVDVGAGDFRLRSTSPAIDMGVAGADAATDDFDHAVRPQGAGFDAGAFEFGSGPPPEPTPTPTPSPTPTPTPSPTPTPTPTPTPEPNPEQIVTPDQDTHIDRATSTTNYGTAANMIAYGDPNAICYGSCGRMLLDFIVPTGAMNVKLRLFVTQASSQPAYVRNVACNWQYNTVNWNTRPDQEAVVSTRVSTSLGWNEWTLPAPAAGHKCYYVTQDGTTQLSAHSSSAANPPQLVYTGS